MASSRVLASLLDIAAIMSIVWRKAGPEPVSALLDRQADDYAVIVT